MRYKQLLYKNDIYTDEAEIENILKKENLDWVVKAEIEEADISIVKKTLIWNEGSFIFGYWFYGIFKRGSFNGVWINGIDETNTIQITN
jgi:hypothetical protein